MKLFVVLVLAVFTGCKADDSLAVAKPQLELLTDAFWDYVAKATQTADDAMVTIRNSQLGQDFSSKLAEGSDLASRYAVALQQQLSPVAQDVISKVLAEAEVMKDRIEQDLNAARDQMGPYTEDLKAQIQVQVDRLRQELAPFTDSVDSEALKTALTQKSQELKTSLEAQLGPFTEDLKQKVDQHLEDFKLKVAPLAEKVQTEWTQRIQQVKDLASPYVENLREKLDPYAQNLQDQLSSLYQSFTKTS